MPSRPAETGGVAGALAYLIAYFAGLHDEGVLVALGVVLGFVPAGITWTVELVRGQRSAASGSSTTKGS